MTAKERFLELKRKKELKDSGAQTLIPYYHHFPKLSKHIPGLYKECMLTLLAGTSAGKSKASKMFNVLMPYMIAKERGLKYKCIYVALEESEEQFIDNLSIYILKTKYGIDTDYMSLNSYRETSISSEMLKAVESCAEDVDDIMSNLYLITEVTNPTGIMFECKKIAEKLGTINEDDNGRFISYIPNDPDLFVILVCDHIALLSEELDKKTGKYLNKRQVMQKWSSVYCLKIFTKRFKWCVWNVQQTTMTAEGHEKKKTNSLDITIEDAGENKTILRDSHIILSLFSPYEHKLEKWGPYQISRNGKGLKDSFRSLGILKNRFGRKNVKIGLHFDGASGIFTEIDKDDQEKYFTKN